MVSCSVSSGIHCGLIPDRVQRLFSSGGLKRDEHGDPRRRLPGTCKIYVRRILVKSQRLIITRLVQKDVAESQGQNEDFWIEYSVTPVISKSADTHECCPT
jgi:hypothetical protein